MRLIGHQLKAARFPPLLFVNAYTYGVECVITEPVHVISRVAADDTEVLPHGVVGGKKPFGHCSVSSVLVIVAPKNRLGTAPYVGLAPLASRDGRTTSSCGKGHR